MSWPWIFYINVPLGIFAVFMVFTYVRDAAHQERAKTIDWRGHPAAGHVRRFAAVDARARRAHTTGSIRDS